MVDEGADAFLLRVPWALDLCRELGLDDELVHPAARDAYVWSHGALRPLPPQLMGVPTDLDALEASGLVSRGRHRPGPRGPRPRRPRPLRGPTRPSPRRSRRRLGDEVLDRLVDPLVGGINAGDTRRLSLAAVVPQLDAAARDPEHPSLIEACRAARRPAPAPVAPPGLRATGRRHGPAGRRAIAAGWPAPTCGPARAVRRARAATAAAGACS